jgi:putative Mg2+ transporter-C (MgtC) family protein
MILSAGDSADARSRAIQGVAIGVGFLGSGHILQAPSSQKEHSGVSIHGLTSAATVWFTATVGISIATSNLMTVATAMLLALFCLFLGNKFYRDNSIH